VRGVKIGRRSGVNISRRLTINPLEMSMSQVDEAVNGRVAFGGFTPNDGSGVVSIGGELRLDFGSAPATPGDGFVFRLRPSSWTSRVTVPARMTGIFQLEISVDGVAGTIVIGGELRNTNSQVAGVMSPPVSSNLVERLSSDLRRLQDSAR
jgi:hypothetical protein